MTRLQPKMAAEVTDDEMRYENEEKSQPPINTNETRITEEPSRFRMLVCLDLRPSASSADSPVPGPVSSLLPHVKSPVSLLFAASRLSPRPIVLSVFHQ
jgi:hypothetical protein